MAQIKCYILRAEKTTPLQVKYTEAKMHFITFITLLKNCTQVPENNKITWHLSKKNCSILHCADREIMHQSIYTVGSSQPYLI